MPILLCLLTLAIAAPPPLNPAALTDFGRSTDPLEPTPMGDGHLGELPSGNAVRIRLPLPADPPLAWWVSLGNVVGYTGHGTAYRLVLRRDAATGPVIFEGLRLASGDDWNAANRELIDLTEAVTAADTRQGYFDLWVTPVVEGDGWTLYRHSLRRPISAVVVEDTPELRAAQATLAAVQARGLGLVPLPQRVAVGEGHVSLRDGARIVLAPEAAGADRFAATELSAMVIERCGLELPISSEPARRGDITLRRVAPLDQGAEAYRVRIDTQVNGEAADAAGLLYAAVTIGQLVTVDGTLPRLELTDWPAYPLRGIQYDVARAQTVNVDWWERLIRILARSKLNAIMIYGEDDYGFEAFPFLGREGTFTPEKAKRLSDYARQYQVQLIPQFEALGHAAAVLRHEELADLREQGGAWVFCTSNPATWTFLDRVFAELATQFPDSRYLHIGADEFESGFGKCAACAARVAEVGVGGLYAEHLNNLAELCAKQARTMLFWPSHAGPSEALSWMTLQYQDQLRKDTIPTEWIYHGPPTYPQIAQYQELGFQDVWVSPAVVCYRHIWPDYATTFRGIRGFHRAGDEQGVGGGMTTTWEWMHGSLVANSLLGMIYAAECAWSLGQTPVAEFERRYADQVLGITGWDPADLHRTLAVPWPDGATGGLLRQQRMIQDLFWTLPQETRRVWLMKQPELQDTTAAIAVVDRALADADRLQQAAVRNRDLVDYQRAAHQMIRQALRKCQVVEQAVETYAIAEAEPPAAAAARLDGIAGALQTLRDELAFATVYERAAAELGSSQADAARLRDLAAAHELWIAQFKDLAAALRNGTRAELPPGAEVGLPAGEAVRIGGWEPVQMSETGATITLDIPATRVAGMSRLTLEWRYTRGAHGLTIDAVQLIHNGEILSEDRHRAFAGASHRDNVYTLLTAPLPADGTYQLQAELTSRGGTDSRGDIWLILPRATNP